MTAATATSVIMLQAHMHLCCVFSAYLLLWVLSCSIAGVGCHVMIVYKTAYPENRMLSMARQPSAVGPSYYNQSLMYMKHGL